ncbi:hypothetical protein CWB85_13195 [Pseudoalteromonas sp. S1727]|nr:hypothetical protein CWB85_13195 [Pseudoalteromonas sp. S1727]
MTDVTKLHGWIVNTVVCLKFSSFFALKHDLQHRQLRKQLSRCLSATSSLTFVTWGYFSFTFRAALLGAKNTEAGYIE